MSQAQHPARPSQDMGRFVHEVIRGLVDRPEDIVLEEHIAAGAVQLTLKVHPADFGKVIGQGGKTIQAVRVLIAAVCSRLQTRYSLEVIDTPRAHP
jgi:uncharacterized protein